MNVAIIRKMGGLVFDAIFEEVHNSPIEITNNPVDTGVNISDHAFAQPVECTILGGVSNNVLIPLSGDQFISGDSRASRAFELLQILQKTFEPFDVQTGLKLYKNMMCTNIRTQQDADSANAFIFEAQLKEVIITYTKSVTISGKQINDKTDTATKTMKKVRTLGKRQAVEITNTKQKGNLQTLFNTMKQATIA